jgi:Zn-dependent peptidase ImmA (M78 family)
MSHAEVAEKLRVKSVDAETVAGWERSEGAPTAAQVRKLAKMFRIPERWLYYDEPPRVFDDLGVVDFRAGVEQPLTKPSPNLRSAIEHAYAVQAWVVEYREREGDEPVEFVGARSSNERPEKVAEYLRARLDFEALRTAAKDGKDLFETLRTRIEAEGVLVLRMGHVGNTTAWALDPDEFKGFTLIDEDRRAPLVFINRKDLDDAQLFTLAHELAHLVTGGSGVSNEDIADLDDRRPSIERFCDAVAEELLLPTREFERAWADGRKLDSARLAAVAKRLKVTPVVAARRATTTGYAKANALRKYVDGQRRDAAAKALEAKDRQDRGPGPVQTVPARFGKGLTKLLASSAVSGAGGGVDALDLLGVRFDVAQKLASPGASRRKAEAPPPRVEPKRYPLIELKDGWR